MKDKFHSTIKCPSVVRILFELILSIAAPVGFLVSQVVHHRLTKGIKDFEQVYLYIEFATVAAFIALGYFLGRTMHRNGANRGATRFKR